MCNIDKKQGDVKASNRGINELREKAGWKGSEEDGRKALLD